MSYLRADNLSLHFGGLKAVSEVSFAVEKGEIFTIIGPNGAGKTSIFNCISGVYHPQQGSIEFRGENLVGQPPEDIARLGVARMFQNIELFDNLTVLDNLMLGRALHMNYSIASAFLFGRKAKRQEVANREVVERIIDTPELWQSAGARKSSRAGAAGVTSQDMPGSIDLRQEPEEAEGGGCGC